MIAPNAVKLASTGQQLATVDVGPEGRVVTGPLHLHARRGRIGRSQQLTSSLSVGARPAADASSPTPSRLVLHRSGSRGHVRAGCGAGTEWLLECPGPG